MIVAIGSSLDPVFIHFCTVSSWFGAEVHIIDVPYLLTNGASIESIKTSQVKEFEKYKSQITGVFYRKRIPGNQNQNVNELYDYFLTVLENKNLIIVNPRLISNSNFCKFNHLKFHISLCDKYKIGYPSSLLSNKQEELFSFIECHGSLVIQKGSSSKKSQARLISKDDLTLNNSNSPILIQDYISGSDVRVHQVGDKSIAEEICSEDVDYRFSKSNKYVQIVVPEYVNLFCKELLQKEGLEFGGVDFKVRNGKFYFLEVNNQPDYRGYDKRSSFRITINLIAHLMKL